MPTKKEFPFKMGADPEFNLMLQNQKVTAEDTIEEVMGDLKGDPEGGGYVIGKSGVFGWDGNSSTGEIRPTPSKSPLKLTDNIGKLFAAFIKRTQLFDISTMSHKGSVGGHIHLELPKPYEQNSSKMQMLHKRMCAFYIPLMMGENKLNLKIRMKESYGKLNDYRVEQHGDNYTYEFRVPSAEWLTSPKIASSTIAYLATVFYEALNNPKSFEKIDYIHTTEKQGQALQELALSDYTFLSKMVLQKARQSIKKFKYYPMFKEQIEYALKPHLIVRYKEKVNNNIAEGWGLIKLKTPSKKDLLNKKLLTEKAKKIDMDTMTDLFYIPHNEDAKVADFVRDIKHRMIAFNWKLKNLYYFFGLKKGVEDLVAMNKNLEPVCGFERQCKNLSDVDTIKETFYRMTKKFNQHSNKASNKKPEQEIMIGIPYGMRIEGENKQLIELLYNIEKGILKPHKLNFKGIINDRLDPKGKIFQLNMNNPKSRANIRLSESREQNARQNLEEVLREETADQALEGGSTHRYSNQPNHARIHAGHFYRDGATD